VGFKERLERADGRAYGSFIMTVAAILFLVLFLPMLLSITATVATQSSTKEVNHLPRQDLATTIQTGGGGVFWSNFTDGPLTTLLAAIPTVYDCEEWDGSTLGVYPSTEQGWPRYNDSHSSVHHTKIGAPFSTTAGVFPSLNFCFTMNDEIGFKLNSTLAFSNDSNLAMTRFNASLVRGMSSLLTSAQFDNATTHRQSNYSWHIAINGERVFGDDVYAVDNHPLSQTQTTCYDNCTVGGIAAGNANYYPTMRLEHDLSLEQTYRVRELLKVQSPATLDVRLFFTCHVPITETNINTDCLYMGGDAPDPLGEFWLRVETESVQADDWQLLVKGVLLIASGFMLVMAIGSTPAWNPFQKMVAGA